MTDLFPHSLSSYDYHACSMVRHQQVSLNFLMDSFFRVFFVSHEKFSKKKYAVISHFYVIPGAWNPEEPGNWANWRQESWS